MISQLHIENFRSIEKATLNLGRITILTGSNNSGKSSLMYGLACLKYLALNPNRPLDAIFNLPNIINLGGFEDVIYSLNDSGTIVIGIRLEDFNTDIYNKIVLGKYDANAELEIRRPFEASEKLTFSLPFILNKWVEFRVFSKGEGGVQYNGFSLKRLLFSHNQETDHPFKEIQQSLDLLNNFSSDFELVSVRRGFSKPSFGMVPLQADTVTEDEIATKIALDKDLPSRISYYLEKIACRAFSVYVIPNTAVFYLRTKDIKTGLVNNLVNEGTGTNQLVTILSKALQPNKKFICIDEPEIHLHPSMIEKLVEALVEIAYQEDKQFLLSTHSEHFVTCLLSEVVKKKLQPDDLKVYYLTKEGKSTHIEHQKVYADGQLEGGLKNFYESELKNLETFFKIA